MRYRTLLRRGRQGCAGLTSSNDTNLGVATGTIDRQLLDIERHQGVLTNDLIWTGFGARYPLSNPISHVSASTDDPFANCFWFAFDFSMRCSSEIGGS
jgi:hypothetical protein